MWRLAVVGVECGETQLDQLVDCTDWLIFDLPLLSVIKVNRISLPLWVEQWLG